MVATGAARNALVVGAEIYSRILDWNDRSTCVLFGDGAGAVVLDAVATAPGILATHLHADGRYRDILCVPGTCAGGAVTRHAVRCTWTARRCSSSRSGCSPSVAREALAAAGMQRRPTSTG